MVALLGDERAIGLIDRCPEQRVGENIEILRAVDPRFAHQREGLGQGLDHRGNEEIAAELHEVGGVRLIRDVERALTEHIEQGPAGRDRLTRPRGDDKELGG